eukprot:499195-Hanusia_phi.AAC.1
MQNLPPLQITVIPRKRKNEERNTRQPITLDKETLEQYLPYSQREAAAKLDISLSALKNVCKFVGITNWASNNEKRNANFPRSPQSSEDSETSSQSNSASSTSGTDDSSIAEPFPSESEFSRGWSPRSFFHHEIYEEVIRHSSRRRR